MKKPKIEELPLSWADKGSEFCEINYRDLTTNSGFSKYKSK